MVKKSLINNTIYINDKTIMSLPLWSVLCFKGISALFVVGGVSFSMAHHFKKYSPNYI